MVAPRQLMSHIIRTALSSADDVVGRGRRDPHPDRIGPTILNNGGLSLVTGRGTYAGTMVLRWRLTAAQRSGAGGAASSDSQARPGAGEWH